MIYFVLVIIHPSNTEAEKYDPLIDISKSKSLIYKVDMLQPNHIFYSWNVDPFPPARLGMLVYIKSDNFNMFFCYSLSQLFVMSYMRLILHAENFSEYLIKQIRLHDYKGRFIYIFPIKPVSVITSVCECNFWSVSKFVRDLDSRGFSPVSKNKTKNKSIQ